MMLQQDIARDYVIATGHQISVRAFITVAARELGLDIEFSGEGLEETATVAGITGDTAPALKIGDVIMRIDPRYFRPTEVDTLLGDPTKAREELGWEPKITVQEMCAEMVRDDLEEARRTVLLRQHGM